MIGKSGDLGEVVGGGGVLMVEVCVHLLHLQSRRDVATLPPPFNTSTLRATGETREQSQRRR